MANIMLIEDAEDSQLIVKKILGETYHITIAADIHQAKEALNKLTPDLMLLDINLPDGNGFEFLNFLKNSVAYADIPVMLLTGKSEISDQVMGYNLGAEDYLIKPINPLLFKARVDAKIKSLSGKKDQKDVIIKGDIKVVLSKQQAFIVKQQGEEKLDLTTIEFKLLLHFIKFIEQIFSRDDLLNQIWGNDVHLSDRTIDSHISHLRKKIQHSQYTLDSVYGQGYRLIEAKDLSKV